MLKRIVWHAREAVKGLFVVFHFCKRLALDFHIERQVSATNQMRSLQRPGLVTLLT